MNLYDIPEMYRPIIDHKRMILGSIGLIFALCTLILSLLQKLSAHTAIIFLSISAICFGTTLLLPIKKA